jgi:hypothetical protein
VITNFSPSADVGKMPNLGTVSDGNTIIHVSAFVFEIRHILVNWKLEKLKVEIRKSWKKI